MPKSPKSMQELLEDSYLAADNDSYIESLYEAYLQNSDEVPAEWRDYFESLPKSSDKKEESHAQIQAQFRAFNWNVTRDSKEQLHDRQQEAVTNFINAYRRLGHLQANIDPLGLYKGVFSPFLELDYYAFSEKDLDTSFSVGSFQAIKQSTATLREIHHALHTVYCNTIGFEFMHINRVDEVEWIRERIEKRWANFKPSKEEKLRILDRLVVADGLEKYLGFKYVGQKRFSLEGGDSLIPMLDAIINRSAECGVKETILGMAHRGRLNVLVNVVGKSAKEIFSAFEGVGISQTHSGDVKYHLGYASNVITKYGSMHIALAFNPSHLEIVSPVAQGSVRARQRRRRDAQQVQALPIQMHGDAAFAGQGVVMETFNMSQARWFTVGGSIHIVINNQVGFTTSNPKDARSTIYCTDIAKMIEAPILHVNGNDPEAVYFAALFAIDYRNTFKRDAVIDLVCYRRHGHNEADEPSATQPLMYKSIKKMPVPYMLYAQKLKDEGLITDDDIKKMTDDYRQALDDGKAVVETSKLDSSYEYNVDWEPFIGKSWQQKSVSNLSIKELQEIADKLSELPPDFKVQPQVKKILEANKKMTSGEVPLNWGYAENLAYATLLKKGFPIRLCGQDSGRGTFAHRHAVLHEQDTDEIYIPLSHISQDQAQINIVDSLLSEEAVLAFEYGYASAEPNYLVIWEAQFGDFANGAQVVMDQFISSGEQKWGRLCGLVMFLPHGYEGQGPEHSSARLERYLQLCAQDNMQVCMPSTPAQIFHLIRRQMLREYRKPLVVMTPKSLLRNPRATSSLEELAEGEFQVVIPEVENIVKDDIERVILCAGKVYYDLTAKRSEEKLTNVVIIRIEQLYPFPEDALRKALQPYSHVTNIIWCQEEPQNQGAWLTLQPNIGELLNKNQTLKYAGRPSSASPAVGYHSVHEKEQNELVIQALMK